MNADELNNLHRKLYGQILAQAMTDQKFRSALLQNPGQALKDAGYHIDPSLNIKVLESNSSEFYIVIPPNPAPGALTEEHLSAIAGGSSAASTGTSGTNGTLGVCAGTGGSCAVGTAGGCAAD